MQVKILFHSYFRELAGRAEVNLEVPPGTALGSVVARLHSDFPKLKPMERSTLVAVGVEYQAANYQLREGDEVSLFPPVQGG
jgi:molybdopterin converting factor small subunit